MDIKEETAKVAYELYEQSGCAQGRELDNWLKAEKVVAARTGQAVKKTEKPAVAAKIDKPKAAAKPAPKKAASRF